MKFEEHKKNYYAILLFVIWPFLAVLASFKNYKESWAKNIIWLFAVFYGFTYSIGVGNENEDIVRYISEYQGLYNVSMGFSDALAYFYNSGEIDVLRTLIAILLSRLTDNAAILTMVYGIIFGFFYSRNMWFVMDRLEGKLKPITIVILICFFTTIPLWYMGGFRMYTAAHIFVFGIFIFLNSKNFKGILIACLSILVHFSFIIPITVLVIYVVFGNRFTIYFYFYITTFFISEIDMSIINELVEIYIPERLQDRTAGYRSEAYAESINEADLSHINWYARSYIRALNWSVMGFLVMLYLFGKKEFKGHSLSANLFSFTLLFYAISNLLSPIPSVGRFLTIANLMALGLLALYIQNNKHEKAIKRFIPFAIPLLLLYLAVIFRLALISISVTTIIGNPIVALFMMSHESIALNDILKMVF